MQRLTVNSCCKNEKAYRGFSLNPSQFKIPYSLFCFFSFLFSLSFLRSKGSILCPFCRSLLFIQNLSAAAFCAQLSREPISMHNVQPSVSSLLRLQFTAKTASLGPPACFLIENKGGWAPCGAFLELLSVKSRPSEKRPKVART